MTDAALQLALRSVPTGRWAVAVSGGADSVALLRLLCAHRPGVALHVVHLNHQTRGDASDADAAFVIDLARRLERPFTAMALSDVAPSVASLPTNRSARYRAVRLALFRRVVAEQGLNGVLLAHHRLDQAETILLRLMRGSGPLSLGGMATRSVNDGLTMLRPLLNVDPLSLRDALAGMEQTWREDASNASDDYRRNRARKRLIDEPALVDRLIGMGAACAALERWVADAAGDVPGGALAVSAWDGLPPLVREYAARRWLARVRVPVDQITATVANRLLRMMDDAASGPRVDFPGAVRLVRRRGVISASRRRVD